MAPQTSPKHWLDVSELGSWAMFPVSWKTIKPPLFLQVLKPVTVIPKCHNCWDLLVQTRQVSPLWTCTANTPVCLHQQWVVPQQGLWCCSLCLSPPVCGWGHLIPGLSPVTQGQMSFLFGGDLGNTNWQVFQWLFFLPFCLSLWLTLSHMFRD